MVSLEFNGPGAGEIKRHPEVEVLLVARDDRTDVMKKAAAEGERVETYRRCGLKPPERGRPRQSDLRDQTEQLDILS